MPSYGCISAPLSSSITPAFLSQRHSNPIAVRRKHQQLPSSLLIENASTWFLPLKAAFCPSRHFRSRLTTIRPSEEASVLDSLRDTSNQRWGKTVRPLPDSPKVLLQHHVAAKLIQLRVTRWISQEGHGQAECNRPFDFHNCLSLTRWWS